MGVVSNSEIAAGRSMPKRWVADPVCDPLLTGRHAYAAVWRARYYRWLRDIYRELRGIGIQTREGEIITWPRIIRYCFRGR